jgi:hypothetical protein
MIAQDNCYGQHITFRSEDTQLRCQKPLFQLDSRDGKIEHDCLSIDGPLALSSYHPAAHRALEISKNHDKSTPHRDTLQTGIIAFVHQ